MSAADQGGSALEPLVELLVVQLVGGCGHLHDTVPSMHLDPAETNRRAYDDDRVEWRRGTAELIEPASADPVIMSGNVAMHLIGQD